MDELAHQLEHLEIEHAMLWRAISMSPEWQKLQAIGGKIEIIRALIEAQSEKNTISVPTGKP